MMFNTSDKSRGFIGPIGDDLPSLIIIVLAITLFFAGVVFCLDAYNQKIDNMHVLTGSIDIARVITRSGFVSLPVAGADTVARSYALQYDAYFESNPTSATFNCDIDEYAYVFKFFVATGSGDEPLLDTLVIRVCE